MPSDLPAFLYRVSLPNMQGIPLAPMREPIEIEFVAQGCTSFNGCLVIGDVDENNALTQPVAVYAPGCWNSCLRINPEQESP